MAIRLYEKGLTLDTVLILPCEADLVVGLRELWRDLNHSGAKGLISADILALVGDHNVESYGDFLLVASCLEGIFARAFRRDRFYISESDYSLGMGLRCQWFAGKDLDQVMTQAISWGDSLLNTELDTFNNHVSLSAALVGAHK